MSLVQSEQGGDCYDTAECILNSFEELQTRELIVPRSYVIGWTRSRCGSSFGVFTRPDVSQNRVNCGGGPT